MHTTRTNCRLCHGALKSIVDLGTLALTSQFPREREDHIHAPLHLMQCTACSLLQLEHTVKPELMYTADYGYASGVNETMVAHLGELVDDVAARFDVLPGDRVLDIACNDGTLLRAWAPYKVDRIGVDPIAQDVPDCEIIKDYFRGWWPANYFKVITSVAVLYDLDDPVDFAQRIARSLTPDGVWAVEVQYAGEIFEGRWDQICHEHLCYYGLRQLAGLAGFAGLWFAGAELNRSNGGSVRAYFTKAPPKHSAEHLRGWGIVHEEEIPDRWDTAGLQRRIRYSAAGIADAVSGYERPYVLGASTKGNVILQVAGLTSKDIVAAIDRNPAKVGRITPGTRIPIIAEETEVEPDAYLALPYHFRSSLMKRHWHGVPLIFPLPKVQIVCA